MTKKIPDAKEMFDTAEAFDLASKLVAFEKYKRELNGDYSLSYHGIAAIVANHAFAIEMYFKCLAIIEKGHFLFGHKLADQYNFLDQVARDKIKTYYNDFVQNNPTLERWKTQFSKLPNMDLTSVLQQANKAFEEHRYMPEGDHQTYLAGDVSKALRKYILELKPDWCRET
jgi:hypothetical protein